METSNHRRLQDRAVAWSLVLAPLSLLLSGAVLPSLRGAEGTTLSVIEAHHQAYYLFVLLGILGSIFLLLAFLGLSSRVAVAQPRLGAAAALLTVVGTCLSLVDWGTELVIWQMGGGDHTQMAALADRVDTAAGIAVLLQLSGLTVLVGAVLLGVGLVRSGQVPRWIGVGMPLGIFLNLVGFAAGSIVVLDVSGVVLLVCMGALGMRWTAVRMTEPHVAAF